MHISNSKDASGAILDLQRFQSDVCEKILLLWACDSKRQLGRKPGGKGEPFAHKGMVFAIKLGDDAKNLQFRTTRCIF